MTDAQSAASSAETKPLFPAEAIGLKSLNLGLNLQKFAGESKRLTHRTYRAYIGYLIIFLLLWSLISLLLFRINLLLLPVLLQIGVSKPIFVFLGSVWMLPMYLGFAVIIVNGIRAFVYRFHDLGLNGWWYLVVVVIALALDELLMVITKPAELPEILSPTLFTSLLSLALFTLKGNKSENRFGSPVDFNWKSFPLLLRFFGHLMFAYAILLALMSAFGFIVALSPYQM